MSVRGLQIANLALDTDIRIQYNFPTMKNIIPPRPKNLSVRSSVWSEFSVWNRGVVGSNPTA